MPDNRKHRGQHPEDTRLFNNKTLTNIREAVRDLSYLLSKHYSISSANKLVGDRYLLTERQRIAVARSSCPDKSLIQRKRQELNLSECQGKKIEVDGYNILITIESALSGGYIFKGRDGCYRDLSSIHGSYKRVEETLPAIQLIGKHISSLTPEGVHWYLDSPISNSGRLKMMIREVAQENGWPWDVEVVHNPDTILKKSPHIVATSDSMILNEVSEWVNLTKYIIDSDLKSTTIIDLS